MDEKINVAESDLNCDAIEKRTADTLSMENILSTSASATKTKSTSTSTKKTKKIKKVPIITEYKIRKCVICGKSYRSYNFWKHLKLHRGNQKYACKIEGCGSRFTFRSALNDHLLVYHPNERSYQCKICSQRFLSLSILDRHFRKHCEEKRYACNACEKRFYHSDALNDHKRTHTTLKLYRCSYCAKLFRHRRTRDNHVDVKHGSLKTNENHCSL